MDNNVYESAIKQKLWKKALCVLLSVIIAFGTFVTLTVGSSHLQDWFGIKTMLSAYAAEIVDTKGAIAVDEESMLADDHTINLENKDGSNTVYLFSEPISFTDENGKLKTKDISVEKSDSKLKENGYEYTNGQNDYRINFSKDQNKGLLVQFGDCTYSIVPKSIIKAEGNEAVAEYLNENFEVFEYKNIYGNGTNLRFYPQLNGVKDEIVLNQNIKKNEFSFELKTENCKAVLNEDGTVSLVSDKDESVVQTFSAPYAYDSAYVEGDLNEHCIDCKYTLDEGKDNTYIMTVLVDREWLDSDRTVYPVIIDPTTSNISNSKDAGVYSAKSSNNYGSETTCCFGRTSEYGYGRVYSQFTMPSAIKKGATISSAYQWERETTGRTTSTKVTAYLAKASWTETGITWSNKVGYNADVSSNTRTISSKSTDDPDNPYWYKFDIKTLVKKWADGTSNYGMVFVSSEEADKNYNWRAFTAKNYSSSAMRPYTVINYTNDATAPTVTSVTGNPTSWTKDNVTLTVNGAADNSGGVGLHSTPYSFSTTKGSYSWQSGKTKTITANGTYYVYVRDAYDNIRLVSTQNITKIDKTKPTAPTVTGNPTAWTNNDITLTASSSDSASGVASYSFSTTKGSYSWQTSKTKTISANTTYYVYVKDNAGNISDPNTIAVSKIDKTKPSAPTVTGNPTAWTNKDITLTASSTDSQSGVAAYSFSTTKGSYSWQTAKTKTVSKNATYYVYAKDNAGNISDATTVSVSKIDKASPSSSAVIGNPTQWTNGNVTLVVDSASDSQSGLSSTPYSFSTAAGTYSWQSSNSKIISANGTYYVYIRDAVGNIKLVDTVIVTKIDKTAPVINNVNVIKDELNTTITVDATDNLSGIALYSFDNGVTWQNINTFTVANNSVNSITVKVKDNAGNISSKTIDVTLPEFYNDGQLIGLINPVYKSNVTLQYRIGKNGEWTDYSVPFAVPLYEQSTVYARVGNSGSVISKTITPNTSAIGAYTDSNTDFTLSYKNVSFDFLRSYNSSDKSWFFATDSNVKVVNNNIINAVLPDDSELTFIKNNDATYKNELNGYTLSVVDNGYIIQIDDTNYHFDTAGKLSAISNKYDDVITITRTASAITVSDEANRTYTLSLDTNGNIMSVTDPANNTIEYTYDENGNLAKVVDQAGVTLGQYSYTNGVLTKSMDKSINYNANGRVESYEYDSGAYLNFTYDDENKTISTESSVETTTSELYNDAFLTTSSTDEDGNTTEYTYDDHFRTLTETSGGKTVTYTYDDNGNLISEVSDDEEADNTYYKYDAEGNVIRQQTGKSYTYSVYDGNGELILSATLKKGYTGEIPDSYDSSLTCFDTINYTYDNGMLTKMVDSEANETIIYTYDSYGNAVKTSSVKTKNDETILSVTDCEYDVFGNVLTSTSGEESSTYIYDKAGRTLLANEKGDCTRTLYDNLGRTIQEISPEDYNADYDGLPEENTYSDSTAGHTYKYASNGTLTSETNRIGKTTKYFYNDIGSKVREEFDIYKFYYLNHGELYLVKVANVTTVSYNYDNNFKLLSEEYANDDVIRYTYNSNGDIIAQYHNSNAKPYVTYTYNEENVLTEKVNTDTGLKYVYGENNKVDVYRTSDNTLVQSYVEVETEANEEAGAEGFTTVTENHFGTAYTSVRKDKSVSYSTGSNKIEYSYQTTETDTDEKMSSDEIKNGDTTVISSKYTYDDNGNITQKALSYGKSTIDVVNSYDDKDRIVATGYGETTEYFTYDNDSQIVRVDNKIAADVNYTSTYTYDSRGNVTSRNVYNYTRNENITASPKETTTFTYANTGWKDQLIAVNGVELTYDANGNVLTYGDKEYTWNTGRHLERIVDGENEYSYTYDENGIRTSKTVNGLTTYYNTKDGVILSQTDGTNIMYFQYDSNGLPLGLIYNGTQYFYITNQMGDVIAITEADGNIIAEYQYDEWGTVLSIITVDEGNEEQLSLANANPLRYRGYYYDNETGYYYLQSRYYDPSICRFINADVPEISGITKDIPVGTNLFAYCNNNPVNNSDPSGNFTLAQLAKVILGGFFGLILQLISDMLSIAIKIQKGLSTVGSYLSSFFSSAVDTILNKGFYKAVIVAAIGNAIKQIIDRIVHKKPTSLKNYAYAVVSSALKYAIKHYFKVKISDSLQRKITSKTPVVIQYIFTYTVGKLQNMKYYDISVKTLKGVLNKYMSNIFSYIRKTYLGLNW